MELDASRAMARATCADHATNRTFTRDMLSQTTFGLWFPGSASEKGSNMACLCLPVLCALRRR
eukprot:6477759-Amphidinium_carterae.2